MIVVAIKLIKRRNNIKKKINKFSILSLDGGGIKGLFSAAILAAIEEDLKVNVSDYFDLISGTSTGGIIAIALGLGIKPSKIIEFYVDEGPKIFSDDFGLNKIKHLFFRKYSINSLGRALEKYFKTLRFGDSGNRLVVPSFNLYENDVYIFRTSHHPRLKRDFKVPAWKVGLATAAAPTFFSSCREIDQLRLIDGGIWANNPIMTAIIEAYGTLKVPLKSISVFSIGTSEAVVRQKSYLNTGGILSWALNAPSIILQGQSVAANNQAKFLLGEDRVLRLDPKVADGEFDLDGVKKANDLIAKARHYSRIIMPRLKNEFFNKKAAKFKPFYK